MPPQAPEDTQTGGFTEEERNDLRDLIKEVVSGALPPPAPEKTGPTDDEWDKMTDRARESWVRSLVDGKLDELAKLDADRRRDAEIDALKNKKPEPEKEPTDRPPSPLDKVRKFLWGDQS